MNRKIEKLNVYRDDRTNHIMLEGILYNEEIIYTLKYNVIDAKGFGSYTRRFLEQMALNVMDSFRLLDTKRDFTISTHKINDEMNRVKLDVDILVRQFPWFYYILQHNVYVVMLDTGLSDELVKQVQKHFNYLNPVNYDNNDIYRPREVSEEYKNRCINVHFKNPDMDKLRLDMGYNAKTEDRDRVNIESTVIESALRFLYKSGLLDITHSYVESIAADNKGYITAKFDMGELFHQYPFAYIELFRTLTAYLGSINLSNEGVKVFCDKIGIFSPINFLCERKC